MQSTCAENVRRDHKRFFPDADQLRKGRRIMHNKMAATAICIAAFAMSAAAQGTGSGTSATVPVFTSTSISSTVGNSPIAVSGSNVATGTRDLRV